MTSTFPAKLYKASSSRRKGGISGSVGSENQVRCVSAGNNVKIDDFGNLSSEAIGLVEIKARYDEIGWIPGICHFSDEIPHVARFWFEALAPNTSMPTL